MTTENEVERRFSETLDRLLAGWAAEPDPSLGDDARSAQAFAQKVISLRASPSARFQAQLKARLLDRLSAEQAGRPAWYERIWTRRVGWQVAIAMAMLMVVAGIVGVTVLLQPAGPAPVVGTHFSITASTDETAYLPGQPVRISVTLMNVTAEPIQMDRFPPILSLMQAETKQPVYTFTSGEYARTLQPDQSATFQVTWDQRDDRGRMAQPGVYYLELEDLDYQGQALRLNLAQPVQFEIRV